VIDGKLDHLRGLLVRYSYTSVCQCDSELEFSGIKLLAT